MKNLRLNYVEATSIVLSIVAIGVSAWAVMESRRVSFEARREAVRADLVEGLVYTTEVYSYAQCLFAISGRKELEEKLLPDFDNARKEHRSLVDGADTIRFADDEMLDQFEAVNEHRSGSDADLKHELMRVRQFMSEKQLERVAAVCGDEP